MKKNRLTKKRIKERSFDLEHVLEFNSYIDDSVGVKLIDGNSYYFDLVQLNPDVHKAALEYIQTQTEKMDMYSNVYNSIKDALYVYEFDGTGVDMGVFFRMLDKAGYMVVSKRKHKIQQFLEDEK
jgi:hypothetical protein